MNKRTSSFIVLKDKRAFIFRPSAAVITADKVQKHSAVLCYGVCVCVCLHILARDNEVLLLHQMG